jgi:hypothetical protein
MVDYGKVTREIHKKTHEIS